MCFSTTKYGDLREGSNKSTSMVEFCSSVTSGLRAGRFAELDMGNMKNLNRRQEEEGFDEILKKM